MLLNYYLNSNRFYIEYNIILYRFDIKLFLNLFIENRITIKSHFPK